MFTWITNLFGNSIPKKSVDNYQQEIDINRAEFQWENQWNNESVSEFYLYPFCDNGMSVLVFKHGFNTNGIAYYIIDEFTPDGKFKQAGGKEFGYTYADGIHINKKETDAVYERIKKMEQVIITTVTKGWK